jgi:hypothetical protein
VREGPPETTALRPERPPAQDVPRRGPSGEPRPVAAARTLALAGRGRPAGRSGRRARPTRSTPRRAAASTGGRLRRRRPVHVMARWPPVLSASSPASGPLARDVSTPRDIAAGADVSYVRLEALCRLTRRSPDAPPHAPAQPVRSRGGLRASSPPARITGRRRRRRDRRACLAVPARAALPTTGGAAGGGVSACDLPTRTRPVREGLGARATSGSCSSSRCRAARHAPVSSAGAGFSGSGGLRAAAPDRGRTAAAPTLRACASTTARRRAAPTAASPASSRDGPPRGARPSARASAAHTARCRWSQLLRRWSTPRLTAGYREAPCQPVHVGGRARLRSAQQRQRVPGAARTRGAAGAGLALSTSSSSTTSAIPVQRTFARTRAVDAVAAHRPGPAAARRDRAVQRVWTCTPRYRLPRMRGVGPCACSRRTARTTTYAVRVFLAQDRAEGSRPARRGRRGSRRPNAARARSPSRARSMPAPSR